VLLVDLELVIGAEGARVEGRGRVDVAVVVIVVDGVEGDFTKVEFEFSKTG